MTRKPKPKTKPATVGERVAIQYFKQQGWANHEIALYRAGLLIDQNDSEWLARRIDAAVRRAVKRGYMSGKNDGYSEGRHGVFCRASAVEIEKLYNVKL